MDERRDDWHSSVDENLASLNAGQRVWERDVKDLRRFFSDTDRLLRGSTANGTEGLIARVHALEDELRMLRAILLDDHLTGHKGLSGRVSELEGAEGKKSRSLTLKIAILGLLSGILTALFANFEKVERFLGKGQSDPVQEMINRAKHPRKKVYRIKVVPPPDPDSEKEETP